MLDDAHDEGEETLTLTLSIASGAHIADDSGTGTIENEDPLQRAWLARFGRTAAQRVLDGVQARLDGPRESGTRATLAGHALGGPGGGRFSVAGAARDRLGTPSDRFAPESAEARLRPRLAVRDLVTGSTFTLSGPAGGGHGALWGHGAFTGLAASGDGLSFGGGITTGMLGADYAIGRWVVGVPLAHSWGHGNWHSSARGNGRLASSLTGLYPYAGYDLTERLSLWGTAGHGQGLLSLRMKDGESYHAAMGMTMAAVGMGGDLVSGGPTGGLTLAIESDALLVRTTSGATTGPSGLLAATAADVSRLRLGLEGSVELLPAGGGSLTPTVEVGLRHDGGDAETGFGVEIGGGSVFADAGRGLAARVEVRGLVAHQTAGFGDWGVSGSLRFDPRPSSARGPSVSLTPSWGGPSSGGVEALFQRDAMTGLAAVAAPSAGLDAEAAYGLAVFGGRTTGIPFLGLRQSGASREVRLGCRLELPRREGLALELEGTGA